MTFPRILTTDPVFFELQHVFAQCLSATLTQFLLPEITGKSIGEMGFRDKHQSIPHLRVDFKHCGGICEEHISARTTGATPASRCHLTKAGLQEPKEFSGITQLSSANKSVLSRSLQSGRLYFNSAQGTPSSED